MPGTSGWSRWWRSARDAVRAQATDDPDRSRIAFALSAAYDRVGDPRRFDLGAGKLVIFSDHHRGCRDHADDFRRCERAYRAALAHYLERGHTLALLGDVEELWENRLPAPLRAYQEVLALERAFADEGRLWRFYGNHDLVWASERAVKRHLAALMGDAVTVTEGVKLDVYDGADRLGQLLLVHGHQGTPDSDLFAPLAMLPVRYVWPVLQRKVRFASTSPATDYNLRDGHDEVMFSWARSRSKDRLVLITGHTHKPVFRMRQESGGLDPDRRVPTEAEARERLDAARRDGRPAEELADLHAMLEFVATTPYGAPARDLTPPSYFNTGCCSFGDGDVTGLEISDGDISLVRWLNDAEEPKPKRLDSAALRDIFAEVAGWQAPPTRSRAGTRFRRLAPR